MNPDILKDAAVLFDLDGTLVDSAPDLGRALNLLLEGKGLPPLPLETVRPLVGRGARWLLSHGFEKAGAPPPDEGRLDALLAEFLVIYNRDIAMLSVPFPGVAGALAGLRDGGALLAVCTNKREASAGRLLATLGLLRFFEVVLGGDSVPARKPAPGHLTAAVAALGAVRAVMVGDTVLDVEAAKAAGIPVIAVAWGYSEIPAQALGADAVAAGFGDVPVLAAKLLAARGGV